MLQSPNYIHFRTQWQILGLDSAGQWPDREAFCEFWDMLNGPEVAAGFDDFTYRSDRCEMGRLRGNSADGGQAFTKLVCTMNQITLVEEWAETTADQFMEMSAEILKTWFGRFPNTAIIAQKCCLRALVQPTNVLDSRDFLGGSVMQIKDAMQQAFKTMPFKIGFTFTCLREIQGCQLFVDASVNSWRDNRRVWVQVEGTYPMKEPKNATNPEVAQFPFEDSRNLLEKEVLSFLNRYDKVGQ